MIFPGIPASSNREIVGVFVKSSRGNREIISIREIVPEVIVKPLSNRETVDKREIVNFTPYFPGLAHGGFQLNTGAVHRC